jgi:hypothetical protein
MLAPQVRHAVRRVVGVIGREARRAQLRGNAQATEDLHRARGDVVALHARWLSVLPALQDEDVDAPRGQLHCKRQAHGSAAAMIAVASTQQRTN